MAKIPMNLSYADELTERITKALRPHCLRIAVAGSVRRRRPIVNDVDLVVIPAFFTWPGSIPQALIKGLGAELTRNGDLIKQFTVDGYQVDLIHAAKENWGIRMLRWTGSKAHNIMLCGRARKLNMKLAVSRGLLDKNGVLLEAKSEERIFNLLHMDYVSPEKRETLTLKEEEVRR